MAFAPSRTLPQKQVLKPSSGFTPEPFSCTSSKTVTVSPPVPITSRSALCSRSYRTLLKTGLAAGEVNNLSDGNLRGPSQSKSHGTVLPKIQMSETLDCDTSESTASTSDDNHASSTTFVNSTESGKNQLLILSPPLTDCQNELSS